MLAWGGSGVGIDDVGFGNPELNGDGSLMARFDEFVHGGVLTFFEPPRGGTGFSN